MHYSFFSISKVFILCHNPVLGPMLTCYVVLHDAGQSCVNVMSNCRCREKTVKQMYVVSCPLLPSSLAWKARKAGLDWVYFSLPVVVGVVFSWLWFSFGGDKLRYVIGVGCLSGSWCGFFFFFFYVQVPCVDVLMSSALWVSVCLCTVSRKDKSFWPFYCSHITRCITSVI